MTMPLVRLAPPSFDAMADVLARAFFDDPGYAWIFPDPRERARGLAWIHRRLVRIVDALGTCTAVIEGTAPIAGALWVRGDVELDLVSLARFGLLETPLRLGPLATTRLLRSLAHVESVKADAMRALGEGAFFLDHLAVDPPFQRRGLGALVVRGGPTGEPERGDVPCGLLTARPENLAFYRALGFSVRAEERCGGKSGFTTWTLVRERGAARTAPRSAHAVRTPALRDGLVGAPGFPADSRGYVHPKTEADIEAIVRHARAEGLAVRVRGAAHSVPGAIHSDTRLGTAGDARRAIEIVLDRYRAIRFDDATMQVTVEAGCRFDADPGDPTGRATSDVGLCRALDERGWALPNMPGVSHATIAGFLSTGSAGGSVTHGLHDAIVALRIVDGTGTARAFSRDDDADAFYAAGVALGLAGVVSTVTLQCEPRYDVIGEERVFALADAPFDPFADGDRGLAAMLRRTPYARVLWWPQEGVDKLVLWTARRMERADYDTSTGPEWALVRKPYEPFPRFLGSEVPVQAAAGAALQALASWRATVSRTAGSTFARAARSVTESALARRIEGAVIDAFVAEEEEPRTFRDAWWRGLPMDDAIDERLMPTTFFELWIPLAHTAVAMGRLRDLYRERPALARTFAVEIYASGESPFWMSPAHGGPRLRINVFWLERHPEDPRAEVLPAIWRALEDLDPRFHWGKLLPFDMRGPARALARSFSRWDDLQRFFATMDPDGLFATAYSRAALGAPDGPRSTVAPLPSARRFDAAPASARALFPLLFHLRPATMELLERAPFVIDVSEHVPAPPARVHAVFADPSTYPAWLDHFVRVDWLTTPGVMDDAVFDESLSFFSIRVKVIDNVPGKVWNAIVLACSLPIATRMVEQVDFEAAADGGTDVRMRIAYELPAALVPFDPLVSPLFHGLFQGSLRGLARYFDRDVERGATAGPWPSPPRLDRRERGAR